MIQVTMTEEQLDVIIEALRAKASADAKDSRSLVGSPFDTDTVRALHDMERVKSGEPAIQRVEPVTIEYQSIQPSRDWQRHWWPGSEPTTGTPPSEHPGGGVWVWYDRFPSATTGTSITLGGQDMLLRQQTLAPRQPDEAEPAGDDDAEAAQA